MLNKVNLLKKSLLLYATGFENFAPYSSNQQLIEEGYLEKTSRLDSRATIRKQAALLQDGETPVTLTEVATIIGNKFKATLTSQYLYTLTIRGIKKLEELLGSDITEFPEMAILHDYCGGYMFDYNDTSCEYYDTILLMLRNGLLVITDIGINSQGESWASVNLNPVYRDSLIASGCCTCDLIVEE